MYNANVSPRWFGYLYISLGVILLTAIVILWMAPQAIPISPNVPKPLWEIRSVDTMKYSRDLAREKNIDRSYDQVIERQIGAIAKAGATHVAIATPYDEEFKPYLMRWVASARAHKLKVWFRGNMSGWEGWFDYPLMSQEEHTAGVVAFIRDNPTLFENGDYFSSCPECENGHLGDPRNAWPLSDYRQFLVTEHQAVNAAFRTIGKNVNTSLHSMNYDVATLVMDETTTRELGGIVAIDHYVKDPERVARDVETIAKRSGGRVFLGEFGAPIPDIHGKMTAEQQEQWIERALGELENSKSLIGINYWVGVGGSTSIWHEDGTAKPAVETLKTYFSKLK